MSRTKALKNVKLTSFDDLFGGKVVEETAETGDVKEIPLSELHEFHNHPFQIRSDEELEEMIESVREHGVLVPGIVRKREQGGYEIIAGHTRKHVCEVLGLETMPVFVKELNDDEASMVMVDSNIQRENIRPSEKAKAYKIKYDAMKNQGKAGNSLKMMSEESGENYKSIQRYIWLARLNDDLLALVDHLKSSEWFMKHSAGIQRNCRRYRQIRSSSSVWMENWMQRCWNAILFLHRSRREKRKLL